MRNEKRIPIVLEKISWFNFIQSNTGLSKTGSELAVIVINIEGNLGIIEKEWLDNPDLRLGQLLINEGFAPDLGSLWNVEEDSWLVENDYCNIEDIKFWGRNYDENMVRLPEIEYILLKDLTTDHIKAIILFFAAQGRTPAPSYMEYFNKRISE